MGTPAKRSRIPKWLKITVGALLAISATLFVSILAVLIWVITDPEGAWKTADKYLFPEDLEITWSHIQFLPDKENWRSWQIEWVIEGLDIQKGKPAISVRVEKVRFDFGLKIWLEERWFAFRELEILGARDMRVKLEPAKEEEKPVEQSPFEMARTYFDYLESAGRMSSVERMKISIPDLTVTPAEGAPMKIEASLTKPPEVPGVAPESVAVLLKFAREKLKIEFVGDVNAAQIGKAGQPFLRGRLNIDGLSGAPSESKIQLFDDGTTVQLKGEAKLALGNEKKPIRLTPVFDLRMTAETAALSLWSRVQNIPGPIVELGKVEAKVDIPVKSGSMWSDQPATFRVWSQVALFFIDKDMRPPLEKSCKCRLPEKVEASVSGKVWLGPATARTRKREHVADVAAKVESLTNKLFSADIGGRLKLAREGDEWIMDPVLDSVLEIHSFQGMRTFLDAKGVLVPAPFDVLEGNLKLVADSPVSKSPERVKAAAKLTANLSSPNQQVNLQTEVIADLDRKFKDVDIYVNAFIKAFQIELPPLDPIKGIPPLARDSRVRLKPKVVKKSGGFKTQIFFDVRTESDGAIRLLSQYAKPNVPVSVNIKGSAQGKPSGFVRLEPFAISYLRRKVQVEKLQVGLGETEEDAMPVDGRFRIDQTEYKVFIAVKGTLESPQILLSSEPYLPRNDIISVLLYDRTSTELIAADAETVGSFEAALADRAIGLFGLWAFASTPIKSFTYNPVTKVYTATVDLGGGVTAGVGTNWEQAAHLEVRRRVSKRWVLTASWSPSEDREQVGKLVLQWEKRF